MIKDETKRFRLLEEENRRLKKLVPDMAPDNQMPKEMVGFLRREFQVGERRA